MLRSGGLASWITSALADRRLRRLALGGMAGCLLGALGAAPAGATPPALTDLSAGAFQILAPGQEGGFTPGPFSTDQGKLYDKLTPLQGRVSTHALQHDYLSEKFGVTGSILRTEGTGRAGLEIIRDSHDLPHIFGETRADVMFGSGWVAAEDRGLLLALGLGPAYTAALGIPGINPFELLLHARSFTPSAEAVKFVEEQKKVLTAAGPEGEQVIKDLESWAEGINSYEEKNVPEGQRLPTVKLADAIAGFAFIGSIFGNGGGNEVTDSNFLARLQAKLGSTEGLKVFRDLREVNDPEAPTTTSKPFPYDQVPTGATPGALVIDPGSASAAAAVAAKATEASRRKASNFLLVGPGHTKSGHPLAVMGPQLGYFYPEIVMQADLHGPGIDAEGIVAPISPYVFIGRGRDFAWSLTSAGSENTQQFLLKLCNKGGPVTRETEDYEYKGTCIPMTTFDAGKLGPSGGEPAHEVFFKESVYGPVSGTVTVKGQFYAIANDRSTRGREPAGELAFSALDSDKVHSPQEFFEAANKLETTFNMSYLDSKNIAYFSTGRLPVLAAGTDPSLPTLGNGEYDWTGFLPLEKHPHEVAPASDLFLNWNNKPAPEWGAASDNYSYGAVHRVQLYTGFTTGMDEANDVSIMNKAATQDLRAIKDWPLIKQVLAAAPAPSSLAEEAANIVTTYAEHGASLLGTLRPKAPGAAIMDAVWTPIAEAVLGPVLGGLTPEFESIAGTDNAPNSGGSSFGGGWYGYVYKDLRSELGLPVEGAFSRQYCGNGSLATCAQSLWAAVQKGAEKLSTEFKGKPPSRWKAPKVRITFPPGILPFTMRWTNRSTFQQVIEFTGHEE